MAWTKNHHSRGEIDRAGIALRRDIEGNFLEYFQAYYVMDNWRASHAFPLNTLQVSLRRRSKLIDPEADVVQRMKRAPSVIAKLKKEPEMRLSRMQDLGGCRSIISTSEDVYRLREVYRESRDRHDLANEKDYIASPRGSGYRGIHLIYKYQSDRTIEFNNHRIEIQLRSRVQHAWATAVEIAGIYVRSPLKSSIGPQEWLEFFQYASSAFAFLEGTTPLHCDLDSKAIFLKLQRLEKEIGAINKLESFSVAHQAIRKAKRKSDTHFILRLDLGERKLTWEPFNRLGPASERYAELEKSTVNDPLIDVVLVSAENIESVADAYPNYFADTREFVKLIKKYYSDFV